MDLGRPKQGLPLYESAAEIGGTVAAAHPHDRGRTLALADDLEKLAAVRRSAGLAEAAQQSYAEAVAALDRFPAESTDPEAEVRRGVLLMGQGLAAADRGLLAEAEGLLRQAAEVLRPHVAGATTDKRPRRRLSEALWEHARLLRATGAAGADLVDAERRALWDDRQAGELADLAMEEAAEAGRIGYGRLSVNDRAAAVRRLALDLAADHLWLAVALGFRDFDSVRKHPDSGLLLSRPDVRSLLDHVQFPDNAFAPDSDSR
jgi:tetratricopeptide (TPR) repeat protein